MPPSPINFSIRDVERITKYTKTRFSTSAIIIFTVSYSARSDSKVVKEPGPAIKGKASGTMDEPPSGPLFLKISTSRIISIAKIKITRAPATANDWMSTLKSFRIPSPENKNTIKIIKAIALALKGKRCSTSF